MTHPQGCPSCHQATDDGDVVCGSCGNWLDNGLGDSPVRVSEPEPLGRLQEPRLPPPITRPCTTPGCGGELTPQQEVCPWCGQAPPEAAAEGVRAVLTLPDGSTHTVVPGQTALLGRDPASPVADALAAWDGAGRRHALVTLPADASIGVPELRITDLQSTNGTYVNGERLTPYAPRGVHGGELRLGRACTIGIHLTGSPAGRRTGTS